MIDLCCISHKGGLILWSRSFIPEATLSTSSQSSPVNLFVQDALIDGQTTEEQYERDGYAMRWSFVNDLELVFVVAYQRILRLTYVNDLLSAMKTLFVQNFQPILTALVASIHAPDIVTTPAITAQRWSFPRIFSGWDPIFNGVLRGFELKAAQDRRQHPRNLVRLQKDIVPSTIADENYSLFIDSAINNQQIARDVPAIKNRLVGHRARSECKSKSLGGRSVQPTSGAGKYKVKTKTRRNWEEKPVTESEMASFDFSDIAKSSYQNTATNKLQELVDSTASDSRNDGGLYEVKDWEFSGRNSSKENLVAIRSPKETGSINIFGFLFSRLTGSRVITSQDLKPEVEGMKLHLINKNVAKEIADKVCNTVGENLVGKKIDGFRSTNAAFRDALNTTLTCILTPKLSIDLLLSIKTKLSAPLSSTQQRIPYCITFVGVNGVGKSTNLSKVCFWLMQNRLRVLIAACDTFRSGAIEQLRVHVRNLSMLGVNGPSDSDCLVELFERGYGKDAAAIAKEAIMFARECNFDIVLIDTAGRMQDNEPLMRSLAKLVSINNPDKIMFVGEALVGNDAVDQIAKFDRALREVSSVSGLGMSRGIDGMLITKWDTVDDKVGAALSMTYVTGQPIYFVGCGQTYTDLRQLRVANVVKALLSD